MLMHFHHSLFLLSLFSVSGPASCLPSPKVLLGSEGWHLFLPLFLITLISYFEFLLQLHFLKLISISLISFLLWPLDIFSVYVSVPVTQSQTLPYSYLYFYTPILFNICVSFYFSTQFFFFYKVCITLHLFTQLFLQAGFNFYWCAVLLNGLWSTLAPFTFWSPVLALGRESFLSLC